MATDPNPREIHLDRRSLLGWLSAAPLLGTTGLLTPVSAQTASAPTAVPTDTITVLYRAEGGANAPVRLDPAVQTATLALEEEFTKRGFRVLQAPPQVHAVLDQGPEVIVTFDPRAGFSMVFSLYRDVRPMGGSDKGIAEVRIAARVFVGQSIVSPDEGRGQMMLDLNPDTRAFGERRAFDLAARKAAGELCDRTARRLRALSPADLQALAQPMPMVLPSGQVVVAPPRPAPVAPPPVAAPAPAGPLPPPARRFALLIGVSDYEPVRQRVKNISPGNLPGVADDLRNLAAALKGYKFPANQIKTLANAEATSTNVRAELMKLAGQVQADDLVLIAVSAHGAPKNFGPSGYGLPVLSDFAGANDPNALDFWQMQGLVANLPAGRVVLLIDTCHAGGAAKSMPSAVLGPDGITARTGSVAPEPAKLAAGMDNGRHFAVLTASRAEELSLEDTPNGGLFTSRLLRGLAATKGEAPLEQVFKDHVQPVVLRDSETICKKSRQCKVQTPLFAYTGRGNMIRL